MQAIEIAKRMQSIKPSATLSVTAKAAELRAKGLDIISLSVGEPDFDTPQHIKDAAAEALRNGFTKYTAVDGIPELKTAILEKFARDNSLQYEPQNVIVTCGAKQAIFNLLEVLLNPGDEVIIPGPYWTSYPDMVEIAEGVPVCIQSSIETNLKITPEQLEEAITPKTRLMIINSPSNPSGISYTQEELTQLAAVIDKHPQIVVLTDDIYEHIRFDQSKPFVNMLNVLPSLKERTIVINGHSKAYAMTGLRIGYAAGPANLIKGMRIIQSQSTSNPNSIAQKAAVAALTGDQSCVQEMVKAFITRHQLVYDHLQGIEGVRVLPADSTFYSFPDFSQVIERMPNVENDIDLAALLLEKALIAAVPGSAFGAPGHLRFSFATSEALLEKAMTQLKAALSE